MRKMIFSFTAVIVLGVLRGADVPAPMSLKEFSSLTPPENLQLIIPDEKIQAQLTSAILDAAAIPSGKNQRLLFLQNVESLRTVAEADSVNFVLQVMYFATHAQPSDKGMIRPAFLALFLRQLDLDRDSKTLLMAIIPYMKSEDPDIQRAVKMVEYFLGVEDYRDYLTKWSQSKQPPPSALVCALIQQWPEEGLEAMASVFRDEKSQAIMLAGHSISDYLWKKRNGFLKAGDEVQGVESQLQLLLDQPQFWARLYVVEILGRNKELRNPALLTSLQHDKNDVVKCAAEGLKEK